jgi:phage tail-like protein
MSLFDDYPPAAFYFTVALSGSLVADMAFSEVSGISTEIELEAVPEGGENRFVHQLPKAIKHGNLELKRGIATMLSPLVLWCKDTLEGEFASRIVPQTVVVMLRGGHGEPLRAWLFNDAYPVKWSVDGFSAIKNEVAIEHIALAYSYSQRTL